MLKYTGYFQENKKTFRPKLNAMSVQAQNADEDSDKISQYLRHTLDVDIEFINHVDWQTRANRFDAGEIQLGWMCGLHYIQKKRDAGMEVELLVAPVMSGERYGGKPVYFSDVMVRRESPFHRFLDLRGKRWSYNEVNSHSGYNVTVYQLATLGESNDFFGAVIESGAHQKSLQWLRAGKIDGAAIDSTVLETELRRNPHIANEIRAIDIWGPHPIPPWVISKRVPLPLRRDIQQAMLNMHRTPCGSKILQHAHISHFTTVQDSDYDPILMMRNMAAGIDLRGKNVFLDEVHL